MLADDHRTSLERLCDGEPTPPRPTSDYQALLGEDPHDAEATDPEAAATTTKKTAAPSLHENVTAALRTLGVDAGPGALDAALSAAEKESLEPPGVLAPPAGRPGRGRSSSVRWSGGSARRSSAN